jgi:hypothetical protein
MEAGSSAASISRTTGVVASQVAASGIFAATCRRKSTEISGQMDWFACEDCRNLIDSGDYDALWHCCVPSSEPMPVQAAWRQFGVSHGPARPHAHPHAPAPAARIYDLDMDLRPYRDNLQALIARSLVVGIRDDTANRGRGGLVARTDGPAILLQDQVPFTGIDITVAQRFPGLLDRLTAAADLCRT